jgi:hypothetical protein
MIVPGKYVGLLFPQYFFDSILWKNYVMQVSWEFSRELIARSHIRLSQHK